MRRLQHSISRRFRGIALLTFWFAAMPLLAQPVIPQALEDWRGWVLRNDLNPDCSWLAGQDAANPDMRICAWPGVLTLDASAAGATFAQTWEVDQRSFIPLPGDARYWPESVTADGVSAVVVSDASGRPGLWLDRGSHRLQGAVRWERRPQQLALPPAISLLQLSVDGEAVAHPSRDSAQVRLGRSETASQAPERLQVRVFRKLADGVPAMLDTRILLEVSGEAREVSLPGSLPAGFAPVQLSGSLNARMLADGALVVQLRTGSHQLQLVARATAALGKVARPKASTPWPAQEIWSFEQEPRWRIAQVSGASQIDPTQAGVPDDWQSLPAWLLEGGAGLDIAERSRGPSADDRNRLQLTRTLWLDFDGGGFTSRDSLQGDLRRDWRLEMAAPFRLTRASIDGEPTQVTTTRKGVTGLEIRSSDVAIDASTRIEGRGALPVTGWQQSLDAVSTQLQLPPGYELWAAPGADTAHGSWLSRWTLLAIFYVAIAMLLAYWYGGLGLAAIMLLLAALSYQHAPGLTWSLITLLALALLQLKLPAGRPREVVGVLRIATLAVLVLLALPFAAERMRLALYPQLEHAGARGVEGAAQGAGGTADLVFMEPPPPPAEAMAERTAKSNVPASSSADQLESITVVGSRIKRVDAETSQSAYRVESQWNADAVLQSGSGIPAWAWNSYLLEWSGPVLSSQEVRLIVSPPWLTRLLRLSTVLLLALVLLRIIAQRWPDRRMPRFGKPAPGAAAAAVLLLGLLAPLQADPVPRQEILDQLRQELLRPPPCAPACASIPLASVQDRTDGVTIEMELHALVDHALPVPQPVGEGDLLAITLDGAPAPVHRRDEASLWIHVPRGVHRLLVAYGTAGGVLRLHWPLPPRRVEVASQTWAAEGLDSEGRLSGDSLTLTRAATAAAGNNTDSAGEGSQQFAPFVRVSRELRFGEEWLVTTNVERIAPDRAGFTIKVPLLPGESVLTERLVVRGDAVEVSFGNDQQIVSWQSRLKRSASLAIEAPTLARYAEVWRLAADPQWSLKVSGIPELTRENNGWLHEFSPLPGEKLELGIQRPAVADGATRAIDSATLLGKLGRRAVEYALTFELRSTRGDQHTLTLPAAADVQAVRIDGQLHNLRPQQGKLVLPVHPGKQHVEVEWRDLGEPGLRVETPAIDLGAAAANLEIRMELPADRWLLWANGPRIGPAVLYWPELALMLLLAFGVSRLQRTPLRLRDWMLLVLGFSTVSWPALLVVVAWLLTVDWRARSAGINANPWFNLAQIGLLLLTLIALWSLFGAIQSGLLGEPAMYVVGNGSHDHALAWFGDRSRGSMPQAALIALPLLVYKIAMLLWALWLAAALLRWLRWGVDAWLRGGYWQRDAKSNRRPAPISREPADAEAEAEAKADAPDSGKGPPVDAPPR